jgi:ABC-type methionine transport system permease subunit
MGAFVEGELHLVIDAIFSLAHSMPFIISFIIFDIFSFMIQGKN